MQRKICNVYCQHSKRTDQTVVDKEERLLINKNLDIVVPFFYAEDPKDVVNAVRAGTHKYEPIVPIDRKKVIVDVFPIQTRWDNWFHCSGGCVTRSKRNFNETTQLYNYDLL